jgi:D-sedoheptulose 7-phosphate isomerase
MDRSTIYNYVNRVNAALNGVSQTSIDSALNDLSATFDSKNTIWTAGNGGSAATASHFATDLSRCNNSTGRPVKAISLCDNSSLLSAIGNDFGFEFIFSHQLSKLAVKGDLLVILSASGNSKNLLKAIEWAKSNGVNTLSLTGFDGGEAKILADTSLHVPTMIGDYGVAEDAHSMLCHFLSSQFRSNQ